MKSPQAPIPKGRPRSFDIDQALDRAMRLFWRKGYLGTSLSDLTEAMEINRPSLYAAFGNKESLFRKALERYSQGPSAFLQEALKEPTARRVAERLMRGVADSATNRCNPPGCLWVQGALSCGDSSDPLRQEMAAQRAANEARLAQRFVRSLKEGDLPPGSKPAALARYLIALNCGMAMQAGMGATKADLDEIVEIALEGWPSGHK